MQTRACMNVSGSGGLTYIHGAHPFSFVAANRHQHTHLFLSAGPSVRQQQLHSAHHLLPDRVEQGVASVDAVVKQKLHDLKVLILDGDEECTAAQRVQTVHINVVVDLCLAKGMFDACVVT